MHIGFCQVCQPFILDSLKHSTLLDATYGACSLITDHLGPFTQRTTLCARRIHLIDPDLISIKHKLKYKLTNDGRRKLIALSTTTTWPV